MARLLNDTATDFIEHAGALVTTLPISFSCWFYTDDVSVAQTLLSLGSTGGADVRYQLRVSGATVGDPVSIVTSNGTPQVLDTTTGVTVNTWHHACAVWTSSTSRAVYIDGGSVTTSGTSIGAPGTATRTSIGRVITANVASTYMSGRIAEAGFWNAALSLSEIAALARGVSPLEIQPALLVSYPPIWGLHSPEIDLVKSGATWTVTGTALANHSPTEPFTTSLWTPSLPVDVVAAGGGLLRAQRMTGGMQELAGGMRG